ncbi:MAG TPA: DinB family protein [Burkholderiales bacterium]|nr:DinB family protein [Burkholderiales bacterium]
MISPRTLTRYNAWANRLIFDAIAALPPGEAEKPRVGLFKNMVHMLNHNYVIDRVFQAHLEGRAHGYTARNTADYPPLAELWRQQEEIDAWYRDRYDAYTPVQLGETVRFTFVGGGEGAMTRAEILAHIVNHTTYHRGFVAEMIYRVPAQPPTTDLTVFLRDVPQAAR